MAGAGPGLPTPGHPEPEAVRRMFSAIAHRYDLVNAVLSQGQDRRWRRRAAQLARLEAGDRALDVCTGTGALAVELRRRVGPAGEVVGVDFTPRMIELAQRSRPGISFRVADACHLPFGDREFDAAAIAFGIRNVASPLEALGEMHRVVRPGGRVVVLEFSQVHPGLAAAYSWYGRVVIPRLAGALLGEDRAYRYLTESIAGFPAPATVSGWLHQAGLLPLRVQRMTFGVVAIHVGMRPKH